MGVTDVLNASVGNIPKAKLVIHDTSGAEKINSKQVAGATANVLAAATSAVSSLNGGATVKSYVMDVQYNPSTLTIQANAEPIPFKYLQQNVDNGVPNQNLRPPLVVLSVDLIFDAMNPVDSFMMDKTRLSADNLISGVAGVVQTVKGGYTVQPQTNGLLSTVLRPDTRFVTFYWADMAFTGQVIEVQAEYTMFSVSGKPVRSRVRMNIAQQVESEADAQYWENVLDKTFNDGGLGKGIAQKAGNLLNLNAF